MKSKTLFLICCAVILQACTASPSKPPTPAAQLASSKGYQLGEPVKKIMNYQLDGWNYINSQALIIRSTPSRDYLVTLRDRCHELSSREVIGTTATGSAMQAGFDAIVVTLAGANRSLRKSDTRKCYIDNIYALTKQSNS